MHTLELQPIHWSTVQTVQGVYLLPSGESTFPLNAVSVLFVQFPFVISPFLSSTCTEPVSWILSFGLLIWK